MRVVLTLTLLTAFAAAAADEAVTRGRYLFRAAACESCHTDTEKGGAFLAGGKTLVTAFGTFYASNITPAPDTGIGGWTLEDFRRAMVEGNRPDGSPYYPVFPYRWYTGMTERDLADLWAYLQTVEPVEYEVPDHELHFPFNHRWLIRFWKLINHDEGETVADPARSEEWNRGAYLVNHLGHCGACHTPKIMGNFVVGRFLAGSTQIPGVLPAPNITPDVREGIGLWSREDVVRALKRSMQPDGIPIRGPMAEYVEFGSSYLDPADLDAAAVYLLSLEAEEHSGVPGDRPEEPEISTDKGQSSAGVRSLIEPEGSRTRAK